MFRFHELEKNASCEEKKYFNTISNQSCIKILPSFTSGISLKRKVKLGSRKQNELDFDHQNPKNKNRNCQIFVLDSSRPPKYIQ
jgi:hypothetical protein